MMRHFFVLATLFLFFALEACNSSGNPPIGFDPFADSIAKSSNTITNSGFAVGAPNTKYAEIAKGDETQSLELDMGIDEEGTGNLIVSYSILEDTLLRVVFWGFDNQGTKIELERKEVPLKADGTSVLVRYEIAPTPYRFVQFFAGTQAYKIDAIKAETYRPDSDGDELPDQWETDYGLDPLSKLDLDGADGDPDGDLLNNKQEFELGTNPTNKDSDTDGLFDKWEVDHELDALSSQGDNGALGDPDQYSLNNLEESQQRTMPKLADTDGDGLNDGTEVKGEGTDPTQKDTDEDGLEDGQEKELATDPKRTDTDNDGLPDGWEFKNKLNALSANGDDGAAGDPDLDSLTNFDEMRLNTNPREDDTDKDGFKDADEISIYFSNPA